MFGRLIPIGGAVAEGCRTVKKEGSVSLGAGVEVLWSSLIACPICFLTEVTL